MNEFLDSAQNMDINLLSNIINQFIVNGQTSDDIIPNESPTSDDSEQSIEEQNELYGCKHYLRRCKIVAPCCDQIYPCRLCHDEETYELSLDDKTRHKIDRFKINEVICITCNTRQECKQYCEVCNACFGLYYCDVCHLFDDVDKQQFHCDKCGFCRIGGKDITIHCDTCGICINKNILDTHKCFNIKESTCPVCMTDLHSSTTSITQVKCGHFMHSKCLREMLQFTYKCPLCSKSIVEMDNINNILDLEVASTQMPEEYKNMDVPILCNECHKESIVKFHVMGHKCTHCGGYNTRKI